METIKDTAHVQHNAAHQYVDKMLKKIAEAAMIVSSVIKDNEPIRHEIQRLALDLLSYSKQTFGHKASLHAGAFFQSSDAHQEIVHRLDHIFHVFLLGERSRLVSKMNTEVFIQESQKILQEIQVIFKKQQDEFSLNFFSYTQAPSLVEDAERMLQRPSPQHHTTQTHTSKVSVKDIKDKKDIKDSGTISVQQPQATSSIYNERKEKILGFLKVNGQSTIVEIARALPQYSQKTVQRELISLINAGTVQRIGDRRWSAYSLIS